MCAGPWISDSVVKYTCTNQEDDEDGGYQGASNGTSMAVIVRGRNRLIKGPRELTEWFEMKIHFQIRPLHFTCTLEERQRRQWQCQQGQVDQ